MKKTVLIFLHIFLVLLSGKMISQPSGSGTVQAISPNGIFDIVSDNRGNKYSLANLDMYSGRPIGGPFTVSAVPVASCSSGFFNVYFAPGSIWTISPPTATLLCQLLSDLSAFIVSPITNTLINTTNFKINLYCDQSSGIAGLASPFYLFPNNPTNPNQGIIDATIYKGITSGIDPYMNIPMTFSNSGNFYHGLIAINPALSWHTDIYTPAANGAEDLYTVLLHELTHSLGFATLIDENGNSTLGSNNVYYSRYDQFLVDKSGVPLLSSTSGTACPNSNIAFTASLSAIKPALCTNPSAPSVQADITNCTLAAMYASPTQTIPVYTPDCFETGSSLSHFEDRCSFSSTVVSTTCWLANGSSYNNLYYVMSNKPAISLSPCNTKRYLKEQEKQALCDMGYSLNQLYQSVPFAYIDQGIHFHTYNSSCTSTNIIGLNDGLVNNNFTYTTTGTSISIPTSSILSNDSPSGLTVSCVEVVYTNSITNVTATVSGSNLIVTATQGSGLALIKYLPKNSLNKFGNATYVYVYFISSNCNPPNSCNMVQNGGFENLINSTITPQCGLLGSNMITSAISCWENYEGTPSVLTRSCNSSGGVYDLGNNTIGSSPLVINSFNGTGNNRVIGLSYTNLFPNTTQVMKNNLGSPLVPTTSYQLSFMVNNPASTINVAATPVIITVASSTNFAFSQTGPFPNGLNTIAEFTIPAISSWSLVTHTFTFSSPGNINHSALLIGINPAKSIISPSTSIWCYIDEVSLLALPSPTFSIPSNTICGNQTISDLAHYASIAGVFSGVGVTQNGGLYNFNANATLSPGIYPIAFTYTNGTCVNTMYQLITVNTNTNYVVLNSANLCMNSPTINLNTLITNTTYIGTGVFSIYGATTTPNHTFASPALYVVTYSYTGGSSLCTNVSNTAAVTVYSLPSTPSILNGTTSVSTTDLCIGNSFSVTASSSGTILTWQPGSLNGNNQNFSPTVTTIYTLSAYNHSACPATKTLAINVFTNCCHSNSVIIPAFATTSISSNFYPTGPLLISSDVTVQSGGYLIMSGEYYFTNNGKIIVENGGDLLIDGAHLFSCETDMWKGIVVKNGGHIKAHNSVGSDNLIEDALMAIDVSNNTTSTVNPIMEISSTTFNKNYIDINLSNYPSSSTYSNPFWINGCVFTCRNFTTSSTVWPQTGISGSGLRAVNNPTTGLAPPYLLQSVSLANLKNPYSNQPSHIAIQISSVGLASGSAAYGAIIGSSANTAFFNLFDYHGRFISADNSNVTSLNNVFQNTRTYTVSGGSDFGGSAVYHAASAFVNVALTLTATSTNVGNRFWDCHRGVEGNNTYLFWIENSIFRSTQNSNNYTSTSFSVGNTGLYMKTNRFDYYVANNEFTNLQTGIHVPIVAGVFTIVPTCSLCPTILNGVYANKLRISQNRFSEGSSGNAYMDNAVKVAGLNTVPWYVPNINVSPFTQAVAVNNNSLTNVFRGISVSNIAGFQSQVSNNNITLKIDNAINAGVSQHAVDLLNTTPTSSATIGKNIISSNTASYSASTATLNTNTSLIFCGNNSYGIASPSVACNNLSNAYQGFVFDSPNSGALWAGNIMTLPIARGFMLSNAGFIGTQGGTSTAISNIWAGGTWTVTNGHYGTYVGNNSVAQNSLLWVKNGSSYPPSNFGSVAINLWFGAPNTLSVSPGGDYNCSGIPNNKVVKLPNGNDYSSADQLYIARMALYRFLHFNDSVRTANATMGSFYTTHSTSSIGKFVQVEQKFYQGDISGAVSLNGSITTTNTVESNYKSYYSKYANYASNGFNSINSVVDGELFSLANSCPGANGGCIYQARDLYNLITKRITNYYDCVSATGSRMANISEENNTSPEISKKVWDVELFPNPATNQVTVVSKNEKEMLTIEIRDLSNRVVLTKLLETNDFIANLDLNLINGVYFITISNTNNEKITKKLLIEK